MLNIFKLFAKKKSGQKANVQTTSNQGGSSSESVVSQENTGAPVVDEARFLNLLAQAEKRRKQAWEYIRKKKTRHTRIPIYTGNPFSPY